MAGVEPVEPERPFGLERLVFFSDAVFAIAMTLLVVDLRLPDLAEPVTERELLAALGEQAPRIAGYVLSFTVIGLYWLAHWRRYRYIERTDQRLVLINLALLGFVAFMPFPTAVLGEHGDLAAALVLYAVSLSLTGLLGTASWLYAYRAGLTMPGLADGVVRFGALSGLITPAVMLGSLGLLALGADPDTVKLTWILIFVAHLVLSRASGGGTSLLSR